MTLVLAAIALLAMGGLGALALAGRPRASRAFVCATALAATGLGLAAAVRVIASGAVTAAAAAWSVPWGSLSLELDPLSAFFLCPIVLIGLAGTFYGHGYLGAHGSPSGRAVSWLLYNLLLASMIVVVTARNAVLFLVAWELMSVASFFLVVHEDERPEVRRAGWIYLVAAHLGTACLLALFVLLGRQAGGNLDFTSARGAALVLSTEGRTTAAILLLALVGFGTKAGLAPLHFWLPEAHPAAPSHVSALMSGVMIKMGIYGILRVLSMLAAPPGWFGWALIAVGAASGLYGVLFSLVQRDLKRLLAYSTVENAGIIISAIGLGTLGVSLHAPAVAVLGFGGALLHVFNHSLFKSLLFFCAGSVARATGTRDIERLGGLLRRMPVTGTLFLAGSVAACALPPLNGFFSELLIYLGGFTAAVSRDPRVAIAGVTVIAALALIGGLAMAAWTRACGIVFLGAPRSPEAEGAREGPRSMRWTLWAAGAACVAAGLLSPWVPEAIRHSTYVLVGQSLLLDPAAWELTRVLPDPVLRDVGWVMRLAVFGSLILIVLLLGLLLLRRRLLAGRVVSLAPTWGCGYLKPTPRMQYTASSYARPLAGLFAFALRTRSGFKAPEGLFPGPSRYDARTPDPVDSELRAPLFESLERRIEKFHRLQGGRIQIYVLYVALTLVGLLAWKLR